MLTALVCLNMPHTVHAFDLRVTLSAPRLDLTKGCAGKNSKSQRDKTRSSRDFKKIQIFEKKG
jgi:hypothetical protein